MNVHCADDGSHFTPPSSWPACVDISSANCSVPAQADATAKGFNGDPDSGAPTDPPNPGDSLTYTCSDGGHEAGDTGGNQVTVTCLAVAKAEAPGYDLAWSQVLEIF